jgi:putative endonuclease
MLSRVVFGLVHWAARKGLAAPEPAATGGGTRGAAGADAAAKRLRARQTGVRGETYAYWYLRRHGYIFVARNYTAPGIKGEIDLVGYDGTVLAFVEVKTRAVNPADPPLATPEEAVTLEKRRNLSRMARHFLADRRLCEAQCRFDVLAIESRPGTRPMVRLHKGAFAAE